MLRRMIRAYGRRVGEADDVDLAEMVAMREVLEAAIADAVAGQRANYGRSWAEIARGLGVARQVAHRRYGVRSATRPVKGVLTLPDRQRHAG